MSSNAEKDTVATKLLRNGIKGLFVGLAYLGSHKLLSALDELSESQAQVIAIGLALLCLVLFVAFPLIRRHRAVEKQR